MTAAEMNARKAKILETIMDENLSMVDLQSFENTRLMILEERERRNKEADDSPLNDTSRVSEPSEPYGWQDGVCYALDEVPPINPSLAKEIRERLHDFMLAEVETEEDMDELEITDYYIRNADKAPCRYTIEEMQERLQEAAERFKRGEGIPHEQIKRKVIPQ